MVTTVKLYVEGGGDSTSLRTECRQAFSTFLGKAGLRGHMPRIVACGGRRNAYESFCTAIAQGQPALLLVDSEAPIQPQHQQGERAAWQPWQHLHQRQGDGWECPKGSGQSDCHLMVQCMETWLVADRQALKSFYGQGFRDSQMPASSTPIESITKEHLYEAMLHASSASKNKLPYSKGQHSFKLLELVDPAKVAGASPWAQRFLDETRRKMGLS